MWQQEQAMKCPTCGTWDWEWEEDEFAWYWDTWTCHGCKGRDGLVRDVTSNDNRNLDGLQVRRFREPRD